MCSSSYTFVNLASAGVVNEIQKKDPSHLSHHAYKLHASLVNSVHTSTKCQSGQRIAHLLLYFHESFLVLGAFFTLCLCVLVADNQEMNTVAVHISILFYVRQPASE